MKVKIDLSGIDMAHNTPAACARCGSTNVEWRQNAHGEPAWGVCRNCGAVVEPQQVRQVRDRLRRAGGRR